MLFSLLNPTSASARQALQSTSTGLSWVFFEAGVDETSILSKYILNLFRTYRDVEDDEGDPNRQKFINTCLDSLIHMNVKKLDDALLRCRSPTGERSLEFQLPHVISLIKNYLEVEDDVDDVELRWFLNTLWPIMIDKNLRLLNTLMMEEITDPGDGRELIVRSHLFRLLKLYEGVETDVHDSNIHSAVNRMYESLIVLTVDELEWLMMRGMAGSKSMKLRGLLAALLNAYHDIDEDVADARKRHHLKILWPIMIHRALRQLVQQFMAERYLCGKDEREAVKDVFSRVLTCFRDVEEDVSDVKRQVVLHAMWMCVLQRLREEYPDAVPQEMGRRFDRALEERRSRPGVLVGRQLLDAVAPRRPRSRGDTDDAELVRDLRKMVKEGEAPAPVPRSGADESSASSTLADVLAAALAGMASRGSRGSDSRPGNAPEQGGGGQHQEFRDALRQLLSGLSGRQHPLRVVGGPARRSALPVGCSCRCLLVAYAAGQASTGAAPLYRLCVMDLYMPWSA
eukprot:gene7679-5384_t